MGRPLTDRWIGMPDHAPVLYPLVRLDGTVGRGHILRQTGSDKFMVRAELSGVIGLAQLTNTTDMPHDGLMCLRFTGRASGFVYRISNTRLKDWHGNQFTWSIYPADDAAVYVCDNTADPSTKT